MLNEIGWGFYVQNYSLSSLWTYVCVSMCLQKKSGLLLKKYLFISLT